MIDVTEDFQHAVTEACKQHGISAGTVTGFTTGGVAGLTTLEFDYPRLVSCALQQLTLEMNGKKNASRILVPVRMNLRSSTAPRAEADPSC